MQKKLITVILLTSLLFSTSMLKAKADPYHMFDQMTGVLISAFVGPFFAIPRGALYGAIKGTKSAAKRFGDETGKPHLTLGAITGGFGGAFAGGFAGLIKAERDAFRYGYNDPWSEKSFSLGGHDILDYDPFYRGDFAY